MAMAAETSTKDNPWLLKTQPETSDYEMYKDVKDGKEIIVCTVGKTVLHYDAIPPTSLQLKITVKPHRYSLIFLCLLHIAEGLEGEGYVGYVFVGFVVEGELLVEVFYG